MALSVLVTAACGSRNGADGDWSEFNSKSIEGKMKYLTSEMSPEEVAIFVCDASIGKKGNARVSLPEARDYLYSHYTQEQIEEFEIACGNYVFDLPLHEKVRYAKADATENIDAYAYELGLGYVGAIRENKKDVSSVKEELKLLQAECKTDRDFYRRFMKGFKLALENDRHRDLDEKIYLNFITYPDTLK